MHTGRALSDGAWECGACTYRNSGMTRTTCEMCNTRRQLPAPPQPAAKTKGPAQDEEEEKMCKICYGNDANIWLTCGHRACDQCLARWWDTELEKPEPKLTCPIDTCNARAKSMDVQAVGPEMVERHHKALATAMLRKDGEVRFCPKADCNACGFLDTACVDATCHKCGHEWEESWRKQSSLPRRIVKWVRAFWNGEVSDRQSELWKYNNAKTCPGCGSSIQKSSGCNHMTCKKCNAEFCYVCEQPYPCGNFMCHDKKHRAIFSSAWLTGLVVVGILLHALMAGGHLLIMGGDFQSSYEVVKHWVSVLLLAMVSIGTIVFRVVRTMQHYQWMDRMKSRSRRIKGGDALVTQHYRKYLWDLVMLAVVVLVQFGYMIWRPPMPDAIDIIPTAAVDTYIWVLGLLTELVVCGLLALLLVGAVTNAKGLHYAFYFFIACATAWLNSHALWPAEELSYVQNVWVPRCGPAPLASLELVGTGCLSSVGHTESDTWLHHFMTQPMSLCFNIAYFFVLKALCEWRPAYGTSARKFTVTVQPKGWVTASLWCFMAVPVLLMARLHIHWVWPIFWRGVVFFVMSFAVVGLATPWAANKRDRSKQVLQRALLGVLGLALLWNLFKSTPLAHGLLDIFVSREWQPSSLIAFTDWFWRLLLPVYMLPVLVATGIEMMQDGKSWTWRDMLRGFGPWMTGVMVLLSVALWQGYLFWTYMNNVFYVIGVICTVLFVLAVWGGPTALYYVKAPAMLTKKTLLMLAYWFAAYQIYKYGMGSEEWSLDPIGNTGIRDTMGTWSSMGAALSMASITFKHAL